MGVIVTLSLTLGAARSAMWPPTSRVEAEAQPRASATTWHPKQPDHFGISALLFGEWGALPKASFGPELFVRYGSPLRWGEVSISGLWPQFKAENHSTTRGARFVLAASQLAGCAAPGYGWSVAGCVGVELGDLIGQGVNTDADATKHTLWAAAVAGFVYRGSLGSDWGLELRLGAAIPLRRRDFVVDGPSGLLFTPEPISGRGLVGISWH